MKILHLSAADVKGGAARAAYRLHQGLRGAGVESRMLVQYKSADDSHVQLCASESRLEALQMRLHRGTVMRAQQKIAESHLLDAEYFSVDRAALGKIPLSRVGRPDVINLHFVAGFLDLPLTLVKLSRIAPVVWTLHDMNPFTGGCHYNDGCTRFVEQCGNCPQLSSKRSNDMSNQIWQSKDRVYRSVDAKRLHVVTVCRWMNEEVRRSTLLEPFQSTVIPYGIDTDIFAPLEKLVTRSALQLPLEPKIVLFVAASLQARRKGFGQFLEAMKSLAGRDDVLLLSVGSHCPELPEGVRHQHIENISDERLMSMVYSTADLFVIPSLQDNLPNTVMESMACGTPVVGFDVGGIPDMVRNGETGQLVPLGDTQALGDTVRELLEDETRRQALSEGCRRVVLNEYQLPHQAANYLALYQELTGQSHEE